MKFWCLPSISSRDIAEGEAFTRNVLRVRHYNEYQENQAMAFSVPAGL